jgi:type VI secretion system secreted protein VgrG
MSRVFHRKKFSDYLGEQRAIDDIYTFYEPDPLPPSPTPTPSVTPIPVTPTPTPSITPNPTITPTQTKTPTPTPSFVSYSGLFCSGNTQNDACFCVNPSVTLYSTQPFYTSSQQVYTDAGLTNQILVGLFLASGGTAYEYQYIYFNPGLEIVGSCPTPTPTITSTPTSTPIPVTPSITPNPTTTPTPTGTPNITNTPTLSPTPTPSAAGSMYKLQAENTDFLQTEGGDDINIEN